PLAAEIAAARGVAALSRLLGRGAGMTVPGKLLSKLDPGAIDRLAARLPAGTAVVSATNGKTTTAAMAAEILRRRFRLAHNRSGANLVSGVASTLRALRHAVRLCGRVRRPPRRLSLPELRARPAGARRRRTLDRAARPGALGVRPRPARRRPQNRARIARSLQRLQRRRRGGARAR